MVDLIQRLPDGTAYLRLPIDRPRSSAQGFREMAKPFTLQPAVYESLKTLSRHEDITLPVLCLAALNILLFRYTGQEEILIGCLPFADPPVDEQKTADFLTSILPVQTDLSGQPDFQELLHRVRQAARNAQNQPALSATTLLEESIREPATVQNPLIQVVFGFQAGSNTTDGLENLAHPLYRTDNVAAPFDLFLSIRQGEGNLSGSVTYNANLFADATITRLIGHFETLLAAAAGQPSHPITSLPLLTAEEHRRILVEFNDTHRPYPRDVTLVDLFDEQVEKRPDQIALIHEGRELTYRQASQMANRLAHYLQQLGVGPNVCVGLCLDRSVEMIIGILGILKAGGAYVPLDPEYPEERLRFMLADAGAPVLLTERKITGNNPYPGCRVVYLDEEQPEIARMDTGNPASTTSAETLAYVIYTSGSTGQPKGVCCIHRSVINLLTDFEDRQPIEAGSVCSWWTSIGFDVSVYEIFSALLYGHALLILPKKVRTDSRRLFEVLHSFKVRSAYITPTQLTDLAEWLQAGGHLSLERLLVGVEPIQEPLLAAIAQSIPTVKIINGYGPTEATVCSTLFELDPVLAQPRNTPIGRPVMNAQIYLLDAYGQPVPVGIAGELYIAGDGLARGYLNRPELTAKKFIHNPFRGSPGAVMYRSGDLARYLEDGNIMFIGRTDTQVKIRGYRIELGEIETALRQHPAVRDVFLLLHEPATGEKRLAAYLVLNGAERPVTAEWRSFLGKVLPAYMLPSAFIVLDEFPLTPNGKVDRKALPVPALERSDQDGSYVAPRTSTEEMIAGIWAKVLRLERVGVRDNFFDLGGESILSIQIASKMVNTGIRLTADQVFEHPTVEELAVVVEATMPGKADLSTRSIPLSPMHLRLLELGSPAPHRWSQSMLLDVQQSLDLKIVEKVVGELHSRHDALRLRLRRDGSTWTQTVVEETPDPPVLHIQASGLSPQERQAVVSSTKAELRESLNLSLGPLLQAAVIDFGRDAPSCLLLVAHLFVIDEASWQLLLEDFEQLYRHYDRDQPVLPPPETASYQSWLLHNANYALSDVPAKELPLWRSIKEAGTIGLPSAQAPGPVDGAASAIDTISTAASVDSTSALLQDVAVKYRTTAIDVLLTALVEAFSQWTGEPGLLLDLLDQGRDGVFQGVDFSRTIGSFSLVSPLLLQLESDPDPGTRLLAVKEQLRKAPAHGIGFGALRYSSGHDETIRELLELPQPELSFQFLGQLNDFIAPESMFRRVSDVLFPENDPAIDPRYRFQIVSGVIRGQLHVQWIYNRELCLPGDIHKVAQSFMDHLEKLIEHCRSTAGSRYTPSDFPEANLSQQELDDLLREIDSSGG